MQLKRKTRKEDRYSSRDSDKDENIINIGDWGYMITTNEGGLKIANNPLPDGATTKIEEVQTNEDGSRVVIHNIQVVLSTHLLASLLY